MANFETDITLDVLDLFYALPKQKQYKLIKEVLSNLDSDELNNLIPQNNTDIVRLNYLNEVCNTNYTSLDVVYWSGISQHQKLSEDFIREFKNDVDWDYISSYQRLSEDFIREFQDRVNWYWISIFQKLSENFIREFKDKVNWGYISLYQKLSEEFKKEFQDKLK
jgi:hypothetical protein